MNKNLTTLSALAVALVAGQSASAQLFGPPAYYYSNARVTGYNPGAANPALDFKTQLHNQVNGYYTTPSVFVTGGRVPTYDDLRVGLAEIDLNVDNVTGAVILPKMVVSDYDGALVTPVWLNGTAWNREHGWPQSRGADQGNLNSDPHHLRPSTPSVNSMRGNLGFGVGTNLWDPNASRSSGAIAAGFAFRGETARSVMYVDTRYSLDASYSGLTLVTGNPLYNGVNGQPQPMGNLTNLLDWHYAEPPSMRERRRNDMIFTGYTSTNSVNGSNVTKTFLSANRNPFIDHPEYVWAIYGIGPNQSKLYFGAVAPNDGTSTLNLNFGSVIGNTTTFTAQNVTLNKSGATPTYYTVTASGSASSTISGPFNAFTAATGQTKVWSVNLSNPGTPGAVTGTVVVDNTDLTSAGTGQGSADGNDTVNLSGSVLARSNGSFNSSSDVNTLTITFLNKPRNSTAATQGFSISNLVAVAGFTAGLDLPSVSSSGTTTILTTNFAPSTNLAAGSSRSLIATFNPTLTAGTYSATYTFATQDQNLLGWATGTPLVLTLQGTITNPCVADVAVLGGGAGSDGQLTTDDLIFFLGEFFANNLAVADIATLGGATAPDGTITVDDLLYFLNVFFAGCP